MDAYDIFKKLTKGLKFKHRVLGVKNQQEQTIPLTLKKEEDIKQEKTELNNSSNDLELEKEHDDSNLRSKDEYDENNSDSENDLNSENEHDENDSSSSNEYNEGNLVSKGGKNNILEKDGELQLVKGITVENKKEKKKRSKLDPEQLKKKLELEEQNRFRNLHGIKAIGRHVPKALEDFSDLVTRYNIAHTLVDTVIKCGYSEPTPIQRQAIPCILEGRQIVACAPTGSGKTAAFIVPLLHLLGAPSGGPRALVLCPTRELAHQIYREALRLSESTQLRCTVIKSVKESKIKERETTIRKSDLVISTPNRLCYLLNQENVGINLDKVQWLIIDEADKLFEGSTEEVDTFRQQLDVIIAACKAKLAMFSATHTPAIAKWARHNMRGLINVTVGLRNAAATTVEQELMFCGNENGKLVAFRQLVQKGLKPPVLVFVQSKDRAKQLFKELIYDGINVDAIHADRTQAQRDNVVRSFRVGRIWVLICTELMGRGIDFRGVNLVINYDFPPSAISYIHRIGRAGRAGQKGRAITFFTQDDVVNLRSIASVMKQSGCAVPEYMLTLKQNANKRKNLLKKAPHRDKISTRLEKPEKRKHEEKSDKNETDKTKDTHVVKDGKNKKQRKIVNGDSSNKKQKSVKEKGSKEIRNNEMKKTNTNLGKNKRKKKNFSKPVVKK
ncbi:probable ATP-dependent RNA helicase DDX52 [Maniola jurtina]|uniref:probable ATP-dependent RNA helicase DDX52 n=1 Tax=Maniola jurtina TaxID=191418 RepID=UPI001E6872BC|nr:probable ATP-dependent RNA helicase DDX52 [Maniola jurtina]